MLWNGTSLYVPCLCALLASNTRSSLLQNLDHMIMTSSLGRPQLLHVTFQIQWLVASLHRQNIANAQKGDAGGIAMLTWYVHESWSKWTGWN